SAGAITPDGSKLLVTAGTLKIYRTDTDALIADLPVGSGPTEIQITNDSAKAYIMASPSGLITVVDLSANPPVVTGQIAISGPLSMAIRPDNRHLVVLSAAGLNLISTRTNT